MADHEPHTIDRPVRPGVLVLAFCLLSVPGRAAEQKGMPQLDFANPLTLDQVVWMAVIFMALYALLSFWVLPKVGTVLADRATRIATDLDGARAAKAEADAARRDAAEASRRSHAEAQQRINAAVDEAKHDAAARAATANAALDAQLAQAEARIREARETAMASLHEVAAEAAGAMFARLAGRPARPGSTDAAVGALLAQHPASSVVA